MNSLHSFLSNAILALSVSTIMLTLLSYLVFKIRQLPKTFSGKPLAKPTRGTFFNRFDPFPIVEDEAPGIAIPLLNYRPFWTKSAGGFFSVITAIIFFTLGSEQFLENRTVRHDRRLRAQTFSKLKEQGLLKAQAFDADRKNPVISEWISNDKKESLALVIASLRGKKIGTVGTAWTSYLAQHQIHSEPAKWGTFSRFDAILIADHSKLDNEKKREMDLALKAGKLVMATGEFGEANDPWLAATFGVNWVSATETLRLPTLIRGDGAPGWGISSGTLVEWFPARSRQVAVLAGAAKNSEATLYESNFEGRFVQAEHQKVVREVLTPAGPGRAIWFALEPADLRPEDSFYGDTLVFQSLSWGMQNLNAQMSQWKGAAEGAIVFSVDSEDLFEGASRLRKLFEKENVPATFFIVADLLEKAPGLVKDAKNKFDFASHTANHGILEGIPLYDQFREIERSRLTIEEISGQRVRGFRPPEERYDATTLNAALQSRYDYFFGDQRLHRFGPVSIAQNQLTYYPRSNLDDILLMGDHSISDEDEMAKALENEMNRILSVNGAYLLSMHSQYFGQDPFYDSVKEFIHFLKDKKIWKTDFSELTDWSHLRDSVKIKAVNLDSAHVDLSVMNGSLQDAEQVGVWFNGKVSTIQEAQAKILMSNDMGTKLVLAKLPAKTTVHLKLSR